MFKETRPDVGSACEPNSRSGGKNCRERLPGTAERDISKLSDVDWSQRVTGTRRKIAIFDLRAVAA